MSDTLRNSSADLVALTLTGGRVTAGFRSALFAAAGRAGVSVNEYVLASAGEKLARAGLEFPGVFCVETQGSGRPAAFAEGGDHMVALNLGGGFIADRLYQALEKARGNRTFYDYATSLMLADVRERA